ncbi:MAG: hypothetical protein K9K30_13040 [Burkholderiaceae bacterium]|nr:hypothetical protein [Burkholderiaceae bacterium]
MQTGSPKIADGIFQALLQAGDLAAKTLRVVRVARQGKTQITCGNAAK